MSAPKQELSRSSSFARSFFGQVGGSPDGGGNGDPETQGPGAGMRRQRSRRRISVHNGSRGSGDKGFMAAAAAAAAAVRYDEGEPAQNRPQAVDPGNPPPPSSDRQTSWYTDALLQGGTDDLNALLGHVQDAAAAASTQESRSDDDEVLEQYRLMAEVEANIRVKENTGFDMAEYEKRRKMQPEPTQGDYYSGSKKPKPKLPDPCPASGPGGGMMEPEEPPLPPPRPNIRFQELRTPKVPELQPGIVFRGQTQLPDGEHVVQCLGCKILLRVSILATLVDCPDCSTVSPASSMRRGETY